MQQTAPKTRKIKDEQRKTFNLRISWLDDEGHVVSKRFFTKQHAIREVKISFVAITRILRGVHVPKYAHLKIEAIREPARPMVQLYE